MQVGTKSVLWGVHQFIFHPLTVTLAWIELYGLPSWKELVCIFIHDLGYWGKPNMDGKEGEHHPEWASHWAFMHLGWDYRNLCHFHSRTCAKRYGAVPSKLCWCDKLCIKYDPWWFYLLRARLSGEISEYYGDAIKSGLLPEGSTHREWFMWARERGVRVAHTEDRATAYEFGNPA